MIYFKACPRCQGDMSLTGDHYGAFRECLMCGYEIDAEDTDESALTLTEPKENDAVKAA